MLSGLDNFQTKFLRVGNEIYINDPEGVPLLHIELAEKEKILERINRLREQDIEQIDGGMMFVEGRVISFGGSSTTLSIPITNQARNITVLNLKKMMPDYSIKDVSEE